MKGLDRRHDTLWIYAMELYQHSHDTACISPERHVTLLSGYPGGVVCMSGCFSEEWNNIFPFRDG
jgi:hypothetical protein